MFTNSFGFNNGAFSSYSPYSNLFGAYVATNIDTLRNDIIIGTAISLPSGTKDSMSLGNVLYGAGFHSPATNYTEGSRNSLLDPSSVDPAGTGKIAIGKLVDENYKLQVKGTTGFDAIVFTGAGLNDMVKAGEPTTTDNVVHTYAITLSNASGIITSTLNAKGNAVSIYTTGNASVVNGSTTVTGVGTGWITANHVGNYFRITVANGGDDVWYKIASRTSTTQIDLAVPYGGTTVSNKTYSLNSAFTVDGGSVLAEGVVLTINAG